MRSADQDIAAYNRPLEIIMKFSALDSSKDNPHYMKQWVAEFFWPRGFGDAVLRTAYLLLLLLFLENFFEVQEKSGHFLQC